MNSIEKLNEKFQIIKNKGYIISKYNDLGYAGKTFENLIGKRLDKFQRADFYDIEIKVKNSMSKYPISLFSITPQIKNKEYKTSILYLFNNYAISSKNNSKSFYCEINGKKCTKYNNFYFKIHVDYKNKRLLLKIIDETFEIENGIYWLFNGIEKRLLKKMKKLAIVDVDVKTNEGVKLCYYYNISFYLLKNTNIFFKMIEDGKIFILFNIKMKNNEIISNGVKFRIKLENISELFEKIQ